MPQQPGRRPLRFLRSIPRNGAANVPPRRRTIQLFFDKNVVSNDVWTNNQRQIRLFRGNTRVAIQVVRIPTNFARRREIFVRPVGMLRPSSNYRLVIGPNLRSRAGERLGRTVTIRFRTADIMEE
ncbi:MAG: Ig-like domain-containing protein [Syntrophomonadaceae bacterium]|jgi:hypothetical protein